MEATDGQRGGRKDNHKVLRNLSKKRSDRPNVGAVSVTSRNGVLRLEKARVVRSYYEGKHQNEYVPHRPAPSHDQLHLDPPYLAFCRRRSSSACLWRSDVPLSAAAASCSFLLAVRWSSSR